MMIFLASAAEALDVPIWAAAPFAILLLSIAICPLAVPKFWHAHYPKVSFGLGLVTAAYYFFVLHAPQRLVHTGHEFVSFIALIGALFVVAGGIHITVQGESRPLVNVIFLAVGAVLANLIGTTGAAMVLIRPWIRMNKFRITGFHIVFFIFVVANVGGCLTPIGDPPLFLGYLRGVPFGWVFLNLWPAWLFTVGLLLAAFYVLDRRNYQRPPRAVAEELTTSERWNFQGLHNIFFLAVIIGSVLGNRFLPPLVPEIFMVAAALGSWHTTPREVHKANAFTFEPIREVAWLFAGIFATMMPALDYLSRHAGELGLSAPLQFYWATGLLSAFLDNAPTYLTFLSAEMGIHHLDIASSADVLRNITLYPDEVKAISLGAVFFGAATYIGNGPNLMIKSIAEHARVHVPGFFAYIVFYTLPILLPILALVGWVIF